MQTFNSWPLRGFVEHIVGRNNYGKAICYLNTEMLRENDGKGGGEVIKQGQSAFEGESCAIACAQRVVTTCKLNPVPFTLSKVTRGFPNLLWMICHSFLEASGQKFSQMDLFLDFSPHTFFPLGAGLC